MAKAGKYWLICESYLTEDAANEAYNKAVFHMSTLNKYAASLMKKYSAHGATDITGYGILGHA